MTIQKVSNEKVIGPKDQKTNWKGHFRRKRNSCHNACYHQCCRKLHTTLFFVFPRVHLKASMLYGGPPSADGDAYKTGWMTTLNFFKYMQHFVKTTKSSKERPVLLILDNYETHLSLHTIDFAKKNGVVMLTLPPHCSHKLQPLDVSVFGLFKTYYTQASNDFLLNHPGQTISIHDLCGLVGKAYPLAFTHKNIVSGFQKAGICPFNKLAFSDEDFMGSFVTDRPMPVDCQIEGNAREVQPVQSIVSSSATANQPGPYSAADQPGPSSAANQPGPSSAANQPGPSSAANQPGPSSAADQLGPSSAANQPGPSSAANQSGPSSSTSRFLVMPEQISAFPKAPPRKSKGGRKRGATLILTSTPVKKQLEAVAIEKDKEEK